MKTFLLSKCLALIIAFSPCVVFGQHGNFFWSDLDLEQGAIAGDYEITVLQGSSTNLFLYFDSFGIHNIREGFDIDFSWTSPDIVNFTNAETFNYDITVQDAPFSVRYGSFAGQATNINDNSVQDFIAVNVNGGTGLLAEQDGSGIFLDTGYDFSAAAFQIGVISFDAVNVGTTFLQVDDALIVDNGQDNDSAFSGLTINVVGTGIPEPAAGSLMLVLIGCAALKTRRRR